MQGKKKKKRERFTYSVSKEESVAEPGIEPEPTNLCSPAMHVNGLTIPLPNGKSYDSSKLKEFADDNFRFDENGGKFSKSVGKHCGKRRNCSLRAISPFTTVFSKDLYLQTRKNQGLFGKGL